jgi:dienelactone hydrolase
MSLIAAGGLGLKIAAVASFHGGRLAVAGDPSSPHLPAERVTATVYVAGAKDDDSFTAGQAELLERALTDAGVDHTLEFYPARHGFAVPGNRLTTPRRTPATGKHSASSTRLASRAPEAHATPAAQAGITQHARHGG